MVNIIFNEQIRMPDSYDLILCFPDDLSIGNILEDSMSMQRIHYIKETYELFPLECSNRFNAVKKMNESMHDLIEYCQAGQSIRIWYSNQPQEYCGMCWLLSELRKRTIKLPFISVVKLPDVVESEENITTYTSWAEVNDAEYSKFSSLEKVALPSFIHSMILKWDELKNENCQLRTVINSTLQNVPENFYDSLIERELEQMDNEFNETELIGNVLGKYQLKISDTWIALRIQKMIEEQSLQVVENSDHSLYRRILKKI